MWFPAFSTSVRPVDSLGRIEITDYNSPVECDGILVYPGDVLFGDVDGVVVIPGAHVREIVEKALEKWRRRT